MSLNTRGFPGEDATPVRVKAVIQRDGQYLLAQHDNRRPENIGKWTFLGGWLDPADASPEDTVVREFWEELQVTGRVLGRIGSFAWNFRDPGPCLVFLVDIEGEPVPNEELLDLRWYSRDEINQLHESNLLHMGIVCEAIERALHLIVRSADRR